MPSLLMPSNVFRIDSDLRVANPLTESKQKKQSPVKVYEPARQVERMGFDYSNGRVTHSSHN